MILANGFPYVGFPTLLLFYYFAAFRLLPGPNSIA